ncbi:polyprotein like [Ceratobasidium sp. AG-Ba]|nr:polyprotein like [Ceratobasidium sp. AG-Ba]
MSISMTPGLQHGFRLGTSYSVTCTSTPPNQNSALKNPDVVRKAIANELHAGCYTGPFSATELTNLIGPFRSAPLGVVAKSTPGEFRIIQDFSFPCNGGEHPALNAEINPDDFQCEWGTFDEVVKIIISAPPGAQAATLDVESAYRQMPVSIVDQHNIVISWEDKLYVDHCVPFGARSSNGIFGRCGDGMSNICRVRGLGPVIKWVDDYLYFCFPSSSDPSTFTYSVDDVVALASLLGWPWKLSKTKDFHEIFVYLGFEWDITHRTVRITDQKKEKYANRIRSWLGMDRVNLLDTEKMVGSLVHCALVITEGRPRLRMSGENPNAGIPAFRRLYSGIFSRASAGAGAGIGQSGSDSGRESAGFSQISAAKPAHSRTSQRGRKAAKGCERQNEVAQIPPQLHA